MILKLDAEFFNIFNQLPFTVQIRNFIKQLLQEKPLIEKSIRTKLYYLIESKKISVETETKYLGGNAISILNMIGLSFRE